MFHHFLGDYIILVCECLGAIGSIKPATLLPLLETILNLLTTLSTVQNPTDLQTHTKIMLSTLIFQTLCDYNWNEITLNTMLIVVNNNTNLWSNYCIGRAAIRYGHHSIAKHIFNDLTEQVSSEHYHFWLVCLKEMCTAETVLTNANIKLIDKLDTSIVHYNKAIAALKVI